MSVADVTSVRKRLGNGTVLEDVSFSVEAGSIYGVVGPNGAGKTTTFRCLLGLLPVEDGSVELLGADPRVDPSVRADVGVAFEYETLHPSWPVRDSMAQACHVQDVPTERIDACLDRVGLEAAARDRPFEDLSKGMKRKASVATALLGEPDLLVLDEPMSGLDPETQDRMRELIDGIRADGRTVVFSSHDLADIQRLCDELVAIADGRTLFEATLDPDGEQVTSVAPKASLESGEIELVDGPESGDEPTMDVEELYFTAMEAYR